VKIDLESGDVGNSIMEGKDVELAVKLGQGNPGALSAIYFIDFKYLSVLERLNIRGSRLWCLYKVCHKEPKEMEAMLDKLEKDGDVKMAVEGKKSLMEYLRTI
jgi:hypothetical protein